MPSDLDIYRSVAVLIRQHGNQAEAEAMRLSETMAAKGDLKGQQVWKRALLAVKELQRAEPSADEPLQ